MISKEILEYAKDNYKIGYKVLKCFYNYHIEKEEDCIIRDTVHEYKNNIWVHCKKFNLCIYREGKWAEVDTISQDLEEIRKIIYEE